MNLFFITSSFALGVVVSWVLIVLVLKRSSHRLALDRARDFHHGSKPAIPRLGGIALATAFTWCSGAIYLFLPLTSADRTILAAILLASLAMFALGFWDDLRSLTARFKLAAQIGISSAVYFSGIRIDLIKSPIGDSDITLGLLSFFPTVFWLVGLTNLINLIDGIDGLAGGICLMLMFLLANFGAGGDSGFTMLLAIGVAGALVSFLRFNYPPAKIYMGDGGAYFLGFLIGALSIVNSNKGTVAAALIAPAFALALPIVDVSLAILRRGLRGLPIFRPDQKHIHHHLITLGISREGTLLNLYTVCLLCLFLAFGIFYLQGRMLPLYTGLLFLVLLVARHFSGFTKNWFEISSQLGKSLALRKETRYALTLSRWLIFEIERHNSVDQLWRDYQFVAEKLRFSSITLSLPDGSTREWHSDLIDEASGPLHHATHEISDGTIIELRAPQSIMSDILFNLLGDLSAEAWYKAASRWKAYQKPRLSFSTSIPLDTNPVPPYHPTRLIQVAAAGVKPV